MQICEIRCDMLFLRHQENQTGMCFNCLKPSNEKFVNLSEGSLYYNLDLAGELTE